jgi:hypothetical protein
MAMHLRALSLFIGCTALAGCGENDLSDPEQVRIWANAASALGVYSNLHEVVAVSDGEHSFGDAACPSVEDDGTTMTITGGCTDSEGVERLGTATLVRTGDDRAFEFEGYGNDDGENRRELTGTLDVDVATGVFTTSYTLEGGATTTVEYSGTITGTYDEPTTWNGSGTITRSAFTNPNGTIEATTVAQMRNDTACNLESLSGTTTLTNDSQTVGITYDGATACDDDHSARWSLGGTDQGTLTGITCAAAPGARSPLALLALGAAALVLGVRRRIRGC